MADSSGVTCPAIQGETHAFILKPPPELFRCAVFGPPRYSRPHARIAVSEHGGPHLALDHSERMVQSGRQDRRAARVSLARVLPRPPCHPHLRVALRARRRFFRLRRSSLRSPLFHYIDSPVTAESGAASHAAPAVLYTRSEL